MGKVKSLFKKLFGKEGYLQLEAPSLMDDKKEENTTDKRTNFVKQIQQNIENNTTQEEVEVKQPQATTVEYNPEGIAQDSQWYLDSGLRRDYYQTGNGSKYMGALEVIPESAEVRVIKCKYKDENDQEYKVELGKATTKDYTKIVQMIDNIVALQLSGKQKQLNVTADVDKLYEELTKSGFKFSIVGKKILSQDDNKPLKLSNLSQTSQYKIDFSELETDDVVSEIPVLNTQAIVKDEGKEMESEINTSINEYIGFCKLAIDIGCFDTVDWTNIDIRNREFRKAGNRDYNESGTVLYSRKTSAKKESFDTMERIYFTTADEIALEKSVRNALVKNGETVHYYQDEKENMIREMARNKIVDYTVLLEQYIQAYKSNNPRALNEANLLNDMMTFSQISRVKQKERTNEQIQEQSVAHGELDEK